MGHHLVLARHSIPAFDVGAEEGKLHGMPGVRSAADDEGHVFRARHELSIRPTEESMGIGKSRFGSMVFASGELDR